MTDQTKSKVCLIMQPAGLGDIFFCQKIANHYTMQGHRVVWPIKEQFLYIKDYLESDVEFITYLGQEECRDYDVVLSLQQASSLIGGTILESKYTLAEVSQEDWDKYFNFKRNPAREDKLFYKLLGLKDDEEFVLVNKNVASPPDIVRKDFEVDSPYKQVEMEIFPDSHIFDWCKVLERAKGVYTVDTVIQYLIEKLDTTDNLHVWSRYNPPDFSHIRNLFKKKWEEHE